MFQGLLIAALLVVAGAADGGAENSKYVALKGENGNISAQVNRGPDSHQSLDYNQQIETPYPYGQYHPQSYPYPQYGGYTGQCGYGCPCGGNPYTQYPYRG